MATKPAAADKAPLIRNVPGESSYGPGVWRIVPAWIVSAVMHVGIIFLFFFVTFFQSWAHGKTPPPPVAVNDAAPMSIDDAPPDLDLTNPEQGFNDDPNTPQVNYKTDRIDENISVPGPSNITEPVGLPGAPEGPARTVAPPPGIGRGVGAGMEGGEPGSAMFSEGPAGGYGGSKFFPGGFGGRSGATRDALAKEGGGTGASEAAVANGLQWFALHQWNDGHWSLDGFHKTARALNEKGKTPGLGAATFQCSCTGQGMSGRDTAATAFALLPFLAAGITHKDANTGKNIENNYTKNVEAGLLWLMGHQKADGSFGSGDMYDHGLVTIVLCEAYGLSGDPLIQKSAQRAVNYIIAAQDPASGGWRYSPKSGGDTSVVGWQVMALKSAQMAGLMVPKPTLDGAMKWLDSCQTSDGGGYGYIGAGESPTMTAVGLLCREYLGWSPRNVGLINGVDRLKKYKPGSINSMYYYYYATQVMHHMGGDAWAEWNPKMRDSLIASQDKGMEGKRAHQNGSWSPAGDAHGGAGGRIMITSLSLLTLEVYYRHLPLYRRDLATGKSEMENK
jgi:hypothetical protein